MNSSFGSVSLLEIAWTAAAIPGLLVWAANLLLSLRTRRAARAVGMADSRLAWADFSVLLTFVFVMVEGVFVLIGGIGMSRPQSPFATEVTTLVYAFSLIVASLLVTFVGVRWRLTDAQLVAAARARKTAAKPLE